MSDAPEEIGLVGNGLEWRLWNRYEDRNEKYAVRYILRDKHEAELSALKKQVEELTAERDDARRYAVEARLRENQAEDRRVSESFARAKAEAEAAALREERDRLNGCLNLANERTDENFDQAVKSAFIAAKLRRENEALRKALGPFANFAEEQVLITENMWLDGAQRERIGDWFGRTSFADAYRAQAPLASTRETSDAG